MNVYLHIGLPKTGSTAIQSHIFANQAWLEKRGVYIPQAGYSSGLGHCFLLAAQQSRRRQLDDNQRGAFVAAQQKLRQELHACEAAGYRSALLSWEGFALLAPQDIGELSAALDGHEVQLLAYVREQASLYESLTLQRAKQFAVGPLLEDIKPGELPASLPAYLDFDAVFASWKANFHSGLTIGVRVFSRQHLVGSNSVLDFLSWLGLEQDEEFALESGVINQSMDSRAAMLLAIAKLTGTNYVGLGKLSRALMSATAATGSTGSAFLDEQSRQTISAHFSAGNRRVFAEYAPDNVPADTQDFGDLQTARSPATGGNLDATFTRALQAAIASPLVAPWSGGMLTGRRLELITDAPSRGWRGSEDTGVWSVGECSELLFIPPKTHAGSGPVALRLEVTGTYFEGHEYTRVRYADFDRAVDLGSAELVIPLDASVRSSGVKVTLEHDFAAAGDTAPDARALAYKLQSAVYRFVWD